MRILLLTLGVLAVVGMAGSASAHYLIENLETPVGTVCALNGEMILDGALEGDPEHVVEGVIVVGGCE